MAFESQSVLCIFFQLGVALVLGVVLGIERVIAGKVAGLRTFGLVSLASCLIVVVGELITTHYVQMGVLGVNPLALSSALLSGIGFLGAGLVILKESKISGLTTAAGVWMASVIGMTVGYQLYAIATFTTLLTLFVFTALWFLEQKIKTYSTGDMPQEE